MMETVSRFLVEMGIAGIFLGTLVESLGIPFPGGVMMILAGILANDGRINFLPAFLLAVAGLNTGATAAYFIGKIIGEPFLCRFEKLFKLDPNKIKGARSWLAQSSVAFILLGRFVPTAGNLTPYIAGISGLGTVRFIIYNSIFAVVWSLFNMGLGYYFSKTWHVLWRHAEKGLPYMAAALLLIYIAAAVLIRRKVSEK